MIRSALSERLGRPRLRKLRQSQQLGRVKDWVVIYYETDALLPSAMGSFWEKAGSLWLSGALHGKVGGAFTSSATQHGGNEATLFSIIANLMHFGMVIVGLPYSHAGQMTLEEIVGGAPYGATTIAGGKGERQPSKLELDGARHQGELIAKTAAKLAA